MKPVHRKRLLSLLLSVMIFVPYVIHADAAYYSFTEDAKDIQIDKGELLAYFSFDKKDLTCDGGSAKAIRMNGGNRNQFGTNIAKAGGGSLQLNHPNTSSKKEFLKITDENGNSLLKDCYEVTVDYWMYCRSSDAQWGFYAAPSDDAQSYQHEHYLGVFKNTNNQVSAECYDNNGSRPETPVLSNKNSITNQVWLHVIVQFLEDETVLAVYNANNKLIGTAAKKSSVDVAGLLGTESILQIGKANWGDGQYFNGYIDEYYIYGKKRQESVPIVWFDGTDGDTRGQDSNYYRGAENVKATVTEKNGKYYVTLPDNDTVAKPSMYRYRLKGWYDIIHDKYYGADALGKTIEVDSNTVFYADWMAESYDFADEKKHLANNVADTHEFVATQVFDYNDLFNVYSAALSKSSITASKHTETWVRNSADIQFPFMNWNYNSTEGRKTLAGFLLNTTYDNILYNGYNSVPGLITDRTGTLAKALFDPEEERMGKTYVGEGEGLFLYDNTPTSEHYGYYYYDSQKNASAYAGDHFEVYQELEGAQSNHSDFLPFNSGKTTYNGTGETNYWFGMKTEIAFYLPDTPTQNSTTANQSDKNKNMKFEFNGDDDVWVFVDDYLCLDLGGIHAAMNGSIDFTTGEVLYDRHNASTGKDERNLHHTAAEDFLRNLEGGRNHTLTFLYLERGSSLSNCHIYFNLTPSITLRVQKLDEENGLTVLEGAEFVLQNTGNDSLRGKYYTGVNASTKMAEWNADDREAAQIITTDETGRLSFNGVSEGSYKLIEVKAPTNYQISLGEIAFTVKRENNGLRAVLNTVTEGVSIDDSNQMLLRVSNAHKDIPMKLYKRNMLTKEPVKDAQFTLYRTAPYDAAAKDIIYNEEITEADGTKIKLIKVGDYRSEADGLFYDGIIKADVTYYLLETQAPEGYDKLALPVKIIMNEKEMDRGVQGARVYCELVNNNGLELGEEYITAESIGEAGYRYDIFIPNASGYELPSTGGVTGKTVVCCGMLITAASCCLFIFGKKHRGKI